VSRQMPDVSATGQHHCMDDVFLGSEALARGTLSRGRLRWNYRAIYRDVYVPRPATTSLQANTRGAWLWSGRRGVIAGRAAAAAHGALWVDDHAPIELIWNNTHPPPGIITRNERVADDEVDELAGLSVTTPARTAFDLARHLPRGIAVAHLDALARATGLTPDDVFPLTERYRGARGVRRAKTALALLDGGSQSPRETWLRLLLIDAGLPRPTTQLLVHNGDWYALAYLDMGWEAPKIGIEYDGDQHRADRRQYVKDISRLAMLDRMGWIVVRVIAEDHPNDIVDRVRKAWARRGASPTPN
jgi:hypothetical protein